MSEQHGIEQIVAAAQAAVLHEIATDDKRKFVAVHKDMRLEEIKPVTSLLPDRIEQRLRIDTKESLVDYVNAYKGEGTRLFADLKQSTFISVIDYHANGSPAACAHRAVFQLQHSEQWARWKGVSGKLSGQAEFVRFLEENCADIAAPSAAELLEICRDFSAKRKVDFREAVRLESGERQFEYVEEVRGVSRNGEIVVPSKFVLQIPVFYGEASTEVHAFLRYQVESGLLLGVELHRPKFVEQASFEAIGRDIAERTSVPLHYGSI